MSEPGNGSPSTREPITQPAPPPARRADDLPLDAPWWAKILVPDIRQFWHWMTTYAIAAAAAAPIAFEYLPQLHQYLSDSAFHHVETGLVILILLSRIKRQRKPL